MSTQGRIESLRRKKAELENRLAEALRHPGTPDAEIVQIKKDKLAASDELATLMAR